jgi:histidine phosphotransfer protein HptB
MCNIFSRFAGDEHWQELLEAFVAQLPQRLATLEQAIVVNDVQTLMVLVHQLKGACGSYGFDEITPLAERLEKVLLYATSVNGFPEELAIFIDALQRMTHPTTAINRDCVV